MAYQKQATADLIQQIREAGGQKTIRRDGADISALLLLAKAHEKGRIELVTASAHSITYRLPPQPDSQTM